MIMVRRSRQRDVILEIVRGTDVHPTADWVYERARDELPRISLGTVYRNLRVLSTEGLIREYHWSGQPVRFDGNVEKHDHLRCVRCASVRDVPGVLDARAAADAGSRLGYEVVGHAVELRGICPDCLEREPAEPRHQDNTFKPMEETRSHE